MLKAAVQAKAEGICQPILLGNDERIVKLAKELDLSLEGIEIINLRHDREAERRERFARILTQKRQRDGYTYQDQAYEQDPFLIALPTRSDAEEAWEYDVVTRRKPAEKVDSGVIDVEVLKVWRNDDQALRPMSVTVQLLKDGQVEDTAVLSIKNNWRCIWKGLPDDHTWRISEEDVPEGYTVLIRRDGDSYTIINTAESGQPDRPIQPVDPTNPTTPTNP